MPEHHRRKARRRGVDVELSNVMQHEETMVADFDKLGHGQRRSPASLVDIPADDMKGRNFAEPSDHLGFAHIAGVDIMSDPRSTSRASGRSRPCVSEMTPTKNSRAGI